MEWIWYTIKLEWAGLITHSSGGAAKVKLEIYFHPYNIQRLQQMTANTPLVTR